MKTLIFMAIFSIIYLTAMDFVNKKMNSIDFNGTEEIASVENGTYYEVSISGGVNNPGIYKVNKGDTLGYLISLAGGLKDSADASTYNINTILENNSSYYIGEINEENKEKISINNANIALLDTLPGIGSVLAKRIVSYRNSDGGFEYLEELMKVSGIGESLFNQIKDLICL